MNQQTLAAIMDHHYQCGGFEFTKTEVHGDPKTREPVVEYRCLKCHHEIREYLEPVNRQAA